MSAPPVCCAMLAFPLVTLLAAGASAPAAAISGQPEMDVMSLVLASRGMVLAVLLLLVGFSLSSWYIIGRKFLQLRRAERESDAFREEFRTVRRLEDLYQQAEALPSSPLAQMFRAGYLELTKVKRKSGDEAETDLGDLENIERSLSRAINEQTTRLESMVPFLATTGSATPFIGLFGTVWGIMNSFRSIGALKSASLPVVAPGIAEALVATAIGLMAAIPAVIAYNYFLRRIRVLSSEMENFSRDLLNIVRRHFF